jgi:hypothetical protein
MNPLPAFHCARVMASYALLQGWSGVRYDALEGC